VLRGWFIDPPAAILWPGVRSFHVEDFHGEQKETGGSEIETRQDAIKAAQKDDRTRGIAQEESGH
jgi:hypothetical protein